MTMRALRVAAAAVLAAMAFAACSDAPPRPEAKYRRAPGERVDHDTDNLLNLASGASVVSRTAQFSTDASAAHAIDGEWATGWTSPPHGTEQTMVFALAAPSRIAKLGVTTNALNRVELLRFEASPDGVAWREVATMHTQPSNDRQLIDVAPFDARYLRVHTAAPGERFAIAGSIHAVGRELSPLDAEPLDGCWTINGWRARFVREGSRVQGVVESSPPVFVDGGFDGRMNQLVWLQGAQWGFAAVTLTPGRKALSGVRWHEVVGFEVAGDAWLGVPGDCASLELSSAAVRQRLLAAANRFPLYGLRFDAHDRLVASESAATLDLVARLLSDWPKLRYRIVAREFRGTPEQNRARCGTRLETLRAALQARGADAGRITFVNAADSPASGATTTLPQKRFVGSIDLEISR